MPDITMTPDVIMAPDIDMAPDIPLVVHLDGAPDNCLVHKDHPAVRKLKAVKNTLGDYMPGGWHKVYVKDILESKFFSGADLINNPSVQTVSGGFVFLKEDHPYVLHVRAFPVNIRSASLGNYHCMRKHEFDQICEL